ncbi:hypothetical protein EVAR_80850_1 [Eumeta japonica]|uniref:RNase H type-1 domain-containing protein n=1 Tax=Eumeta variegata TaxID=151549 RepID=A0A4C1V1X0_EUMVA|nr:hypothetical protein EVAR_80850_1 [Eumeta japonica]
MDRLAIIRSHIYTDGSRIEGKVGAALTEWRDGMEFGNSAYRLNPSARYSNEARHPGYRCGMQGGCAYFGCVHTRVPQATNVLTSSSEMPPSKRRRQQTMIAFRCRTPKRRSGRRAWTSSSRDTPREALVT